MDEILANFILQCLNCEKKLRRFNARFFIITLFSYIYIYIKIIRYR